MARISGDATPAAMASAIASERDNPTGAKVMAQDCSMYDPAGMAAMCQAMIAAHPGE